MTSEQAVLHDAQEGLSDPGYAALSRTQNRFTLSTTGATEDRVRNEMPGEPGEQGERMTGKFPPQAGEPDATPQPAALFSDAGAATDRPARPAGGPPPVSVVWQAPGEPGSAR
ncbi:hypothetical protein AB0A98_06485 [Streptomyces chrestomyceticus]|uniref:hypothetical protein n=1 Tax=Streptomyces chrestomyceticus TaxID=68185 RepID=UPI00340716A2